MRKITKHFHGTIELTRVARMPRADYDVLNADPMSHTDRSARRWSDAVVVGYIPRPTDVREPLSLEHMRPLLVERTVKVIAAENTHVCDWRCEGAKKGSECRCSCGGRNHGIKGAAHPAL